MFINYLYFLGSYLENVYLYPVRKFLDEFYMLYTEEGHAIRCEKKYCFVFVQTPGLLYSLFSARNSFSGTWVNVLLSILNISFHNERFIHGIIWYTSQSLQIVIAFSRLSQCLLEDV